MSAADCGLPDGGRWTAEDGRLCTLPTADPADGGRSLADPPDAGLSFADPAEGGLSFADPAEGGLADGEAGLSFTEPAEGGLSAAGEPAPDCLPAEPRRLPAAEPGLLAAEEGLDPALEPAFIVIKIYPYFHIIYHHDCIQDLLRATDK